MLEPEQQPIVVVTRRVHRGSSTITTSASPHNSSKRCQSADERVSRGTSSASTAPTRPLCDAFREPLEAVAPARASSALAQIVIDARA